MAEAVKQPSEMTLLEVVEALTKWHTEHDLDCEEGVGSERCAPCLAKAGVKLLTDAGTALYPGGEWDSPITVTARKGDVAAAAQALGYANNPSTEALAFQQTLLGALEKGTADA